MFRHTELYSTTRPLTDLSNTELESMLHAAELNNLKVLKGMISLVLKVRLDDGARRLLTEVRYEVPRFVPGEELFAFGDTHFTGLPHHGRD